MAVFKNVDVTHIPKRMQGDGIENGEYATVGKDVTVSNIEGNITIEKAIKYYESKKDVLSKRTADWLREYLMSMYKSENK